MCHSENCLKIRAAYQSEDECDFEIVLPEVYVKFADLYEVIA